jgi:Domain of unknown function (DUF1835)
LPPGIHIVLGDSAAQTFRRAFDPSDSPLIDQDVLSCGPTPATCDLAAWQNVRERYWRNLVPGDADEHVHSPFNVVGNAHRLKEGEPVYVWAATSLSEQLFVAFVIHLADAVGADVKRISLVQFEQLRGRDARVMGIGELQIEQMAEHPEPMQLSDETLTDYRIAWAALTSEDPVLLQTFTNDRPNANRWLIQAMPLMLRRFPDRTSGLTYWDRVLLEKVRDHAPNTPLVIGAALGHDWRDPDLTGDRYLFGRLLRLGDARLPKPLVTLTGEKPDMREMKVDLTPFGADVLDGIATNYPTNPIDEWAAGVKLSSADGALWFRDGDKLTRAGAK